MKARKVMLKDYYGKSLLWLAQSLVIIGPTKLKIKLSVPKYHVAMAAINYFGTEEGQHDETHWRDLEFPGYLGDNHVASRKLSKLNFVTEIIHKCGIGDYNNGIQAKMNDGEKDVAAYAGKILLELMPEITTSYWLNINAALADKQVDAALEEVDEITLIDEANRNLSEAMEVEDGQTVLSMLVQSTNKAIARATAANAANKKKEARKKSSGGDKTQALKPIKDGQKLKRKSEKKRKKKYPSSKSSSMPNLEKPTPSPAHPRTEENRHNRGRHGGSRKERRGRGVKGRS